MGMSTSESAIANQVLRRFVDDAITKSLAPDDVESKVKMLAGKVAMIAATNICFTKIGSRYYRVDSARVAKAARFGPLCPYIKISKNDALGRELSILRQTHSVFCRMLIKARRLKLQPKIVVSLAVLHRWEENLRHKNKSSSLKI